MKAINFQKRWMVARWLIGTTFFLHGVILSVSAFVGSFVLSLLLVGLGFMVLGIAVGKMVWKSALAWLKNCYER